MNAITKTRIRYWQPRPYVAGVKDGALSWWFYRRYVKGSDIWTRNWLGRWWLEIWS